MALPETARKSYPNRGFASMDRTKQKRIASMGGKSAHALGVAHEWTPEEASLAGSKGGVLSAESRRKRAAERKAKGESQQTA